MSANQCLTSVRLYETATRYYIIGCTQDEEHFSVLRIDRTVDESQFTLVEDEAVYSKQQINELLLALNSGNASSGGLHNILTCCGIIGLVRFTANYYISVITKRSIVALLGGHYIYHIENTKLIPLLSSVPQKKRDRNSGEEARYLAIWQNMELNKTFYYANTYDITHTLQHNLTSADAPQDRFMGRFNEMFVWNHYLLHTAFSTIRQHANWCVPLIHGFIDQAKLMILGKPVYVTLIARRSRHFAGARFLKRGANEQGHVANDVESEQIVSEALTTPFHRPDGTLNSQYTSFVQHRGSIPLNWSQPVDGVNPKPPIELNVIDPFFTAAALHFDNMFERYGSPIFVINLIKQRERTPRETLLLAEFTQMIQYLNQFLPEKHKLQYIAWDMSRASKSRDQKVIERLEDIASETIVKTGIFHSGRTPTVQSGVARTNCIDCLDRTNAAQFVIGKHALSVQLHALGLVQSPQDIKFDCDAVSMIIEMFHDHGDTIALQYGGSHLVNTMETYRKINQWSSHSRDMIESIKRFYHNSFLDAQRQDAINLFLGNFKVPDAHLGGQRLWEMGNDYRLHFNDSTLFEGHRNYQLWWTPRNLKDTQVISKMLQVQKAVLPDANDRYWQEYYRPKVVSSIDKIFAFNMNSTARYLSSKQLQDEAFDPSPFVVRLHTSPAPSSSRPDESQYKTGAANDEKHKKAKNRNTAISLHRWLGHTIPARTEAVRVQDVPVVPDSPEQVPEEEILRALASLLITDEQDVRIYQDFIDRAYRPDYRPGSGRTSTETLAQDFAALKKTYAQFTPLADCSVSQQDMSLYEASIAAIIA